METHSCGIYNYFVDVNCVYSFDLIGTAGCGPLTENTLRSHGYPNDYPKNTGCISRVPILQDMVINITIDQLYQVNSISCE